MSIQFKTIQQLREMLDKKVISSEELIDETLKLAEDLKDLNCFVTMNEDASIEKAKKLIKPKESILHYLESLWLKKIYSALRGLELLALQKFSQTLYLHILQRQLKNWRVQDQ